MAGNEKRLRATTTSDEGLGLGGLGVKRIEKREARRATESLYLKQRKRRGETGSSPF